MTMRLRNRGDLIILIIMTATSGLPAQAADYRRLGGAEIRSHFQGMELTDETHWGLIFGPNGQLGSVENGSENREAGTWRVIGDELCLTFRQDQPRCHEVRMLGRGVRLVRDGEPSLDGILQRATANKKGIE